MGVLRATVYFLSSLGCEPDRGSRRVSLLLEAVMGEGLVGLGHAVHFLALLHGAAAAFRGLEKLVGQALAHALLAALAGGLAQPAHGKRGAPDGADFHRHLVVGAADAA